MAADGPWDAQAPLERLSVEELKAFQVKLQIIRRIASRRLDALQVRGESIFCRCHALTLSSPLRLVSCSWKRWHCCKSKLR